MMQTTGAATSDIFETGGVRVAIEGCGHGTLDAIYASVERSCTERGWDGVDLLIIGGDFQATRNAADLTVMSVPAKFREMGDFHAYYGGTRTAPYLTVFVGGNHEAAAHLWELFYGGWVAPNIYYMGAANVLRLGPLRLAGLSGIWKGFDYRRPHHERLPFNQDDVKSFYHVRQIDVRRLLQVCEPVDIGISHDWPRGIERHGDHARLFRQKPMFRSESEEGSLGSVAAEHVMDRLRPRYWFSAHLHCKYAAIKQYAPPDKVLPAVDLASSRTAIAAEPVAAAAVDNPDEIDLDLDDDGDDASAGASSSKPVETAPQIAQTSVLGIPDDVLAQLPASFQRLPSARPPQPGQPVPPTITNTTVRFLALDKCLPGRHYLQVCEIPPASTEAAAAAAAVAPTSHPGRYRLEYDPEWLAITRVFANELVIGAGAASPPTPNDRGELQYRKLIDEERRWVDEHIVAKDRLAVPANFVLTAPVHTPVPGRPDTHASGQPVEYTNPQTAAFCALVGVPNLWDAPEAEREERRLRGPAPRRLDKGTRSKRYYGAGSSELS
ncbi:RNA lariat debranching protein [Grosmannia clavigera kw1407]|uniref:RNA lariat debranching protein n=1 Tax=Grosmannia clavigera (strain kw1407 / UAMH 11150) TaxID=655863 RepID=F0X6Q3_GROCL|nr:RNA lariat debranching protein [Grosmannia clavigera kw1407]EFX06254.1 RNA lariat debranching protein [Grosmannia clavigera kw1407]